MADDQRKPWVLPVFFGILIVLFWLVTDLMKAPEGAKVQAPVVEEVPPAPLAMTVTAESMTVTAGQ
jgi:hypothetical protein